MYYVYVLSSIRYKKSYTGTTDNIQRRLDEHNTGKTPYSRRYKPWKLIHYEQFPTLSEARKRESYYKSGAGRNKLKEIFLNNARSSKGRTADSGSANLGSNPSLAAIKLSTPVIRIDS